MDSKGGLTTVRAVEARAILNANTGRHSIESKLPLSPLEVAILAPGRSVRLQGNVLTVNERYASIAEMGEAIDSLYHILPPLLNVSFADAPFVERVQGHVGGVEFRWELSDWRMKFRTTTQEEQEKKVVAAWERLGCMCESTRTRILAGAGYFHTACRLARVNNTPGEFVSEVILNLAKCLEVLFPSAGDGRSRDAVRIGLDSLGFSPYQIERDYMPAIALRNEIDVAHVQLGLFSSIQLKAIHAYTERSEDSFRDLLECVMSKVESGEDVIAAYSQRGVSKDVAKIIERLIKVDNENDN